MNKPACTLCRAMVSASILLILLSAVPTVAKASFSTLSTSVMTSPVGFEGLQESCSPCNQPDVQVAAGPNQLVEIVNRQVAVYSKSGVQSSNTDLSTFFQAGTDFTLDSRILYDVLGQRWFATTVDASVSNIRIAVSKTTDATTNPSDWYHYSLGQPATRCYDHAQIGVSSDKFVVTAFAPAYNGNPCFPTVPVTNQYWVLNKADMMSGATTVNNVTVTSLPFEYTQPSHALTPTNTIYIEAASSYSRLTVITINGLPPNVTNTTTTVIPPSPMIPPPEAPTPGTNVVLPPPASESSIQAQSLVFARGQLWSTYEVGCTPQTDNTLRSCIQLLDLNATSTSLSILQNFDYATKGQYFFFPALSLDGYGNMQMLLGYSNSTTWPTLAITGQAWNDPANSLAAKLSVASSNGGPPNNKAGDYFAAEPDPVDPSLVWVGGETCCTNFGAWRTFIASARISDFSLTATPSSLSLTAGKTSHVTIKVTSTSGGFSSAVTLSATGPSGITLSFMTNPITPPPNGYATTTLNILPDANCNIGNGRTITVLATSGSIVRSTAITITSIRC